MALHIALALALIETLALAALLHAWADRVAGARLLVLFLLGVAVWITANELPNWFGPQAIPVALRLLASVSTTAAVFLHFCLVFCGVPLHRRWLQAAYAAGLAGTLVSVIVTPGTYQPFAGITWVPMPNWAGWLTSAIWTVLASAGVVVLGLGLLKARGQARRQVAAVALSCGWGLLCMSGYGVAALQLPYYPWPLLGVPGYPLILVYGILRYRVFVANAWARRALVWAVLIGLGLAMVPLTLLLPVESRWISGAAVALTCLALSGPVRRFAEKLVYPGGSVSAPDLARWRAELANAESLPALASLGAARLSERVGLQVDVRVVARVHAQLGAQVDAGNLAEAPQPPGALATGPTFPPIIEPGADTLARREGAGAGAAAPSPTSAMPGLLCLQTGNGWASELRGWDSAPPGPRHAAEFFGAVLAEVAGEVERAQQREQRERERQLQARLAELGSLAATVAHDLRNPLNIIAMAVATSEPETRREVAQQVQRISRLAADLLDYAKPWQLDSHAFDLAAYLRESLRGAIGRSAAVDLDDSLQQPLPVHADARRVDQVFANLLANARSAAGAQPVHIAAETEAGEVLIHVCDNGPGVPDEIRERLFQPFASRSPGGTGLGLAIVARIMAAHGGSVALTERAPWRTCFTLRFPAPSATPQRSRPALASPAQAPAASGGQAPTPRRLDLPGRPS